MKNRRNRKLVKSDFGKMWFLHNKAASVRSTGGLSKFGNVLDKLYEVTKDESVLQYRQNLDCTSDYGRAKFCMYRGIHYGAALNGKLIYCVVS